MRVLPILLCALALACGSKAPPPPTEVAPAIEVEPPPPPRTYQVPSHFAALGGACPASDVQCAICNQDGRVVAVVQPGDFLNLHDDPGVFKESRDQQWGQWWWSIAASGGVVRAQILTCPQCRRQMGWSIMIDLAELERTPDPTRMELQTALGYPALPLLGTEEEWRATPPEKPGRGLACPP